ncbi:MAG: hypothetical protein ACK5N4_03630 [Parabacteroides gordonii]|uniref:hypothetical protein n=1 Tax=Parabacteroides gordonii TaxID=574930 RepID=UPI003A83C5A4
MLILIAIYINFFILACLTLISWGYVDNVIDTDVEASVDTGVDTVIEVGVDNGVEGDVDNSFDIPLDSSLLDNRTVIFAATRLTACAQ